MLNCNRHLAVTGVKVSATGVSATRIFQRAVAGGDPFSLNN